MTKIGSRCISVGTTMTTKGTISLDQPQKSTMPRAPSTQIWPQLKRILTAKNPHQLALLPQQIPLHQQPFKNLRVAQRKTISDSSFSQLKYCTLRETRNSGWKCTPKGCLNRSKGRRYPFISGSFGLTRISRSSLKSRNRNMKCKRYRCRLRQRRRNRRLLWINNRCSNQ